MLDLRSWISCKSIGGLSLTHTADAHALGTALGGNPPEALALELVVADALHAPDVAHGHTALGVGELDHLEQTEEALALRARCIGFLEDEIRLDGRAEEEVLQGLMGLHNGGLGAGWWRGRWRSHRGFRTGPGTGHHSWRITRSGHHHRIRSWWRCRFLKKEGIIKILSEKCFKKGFPKKYVIDNIDM